MNLKTTTLVLCSLSMAHASAALRLPALMSNHMVLQADEAVAVWGWADPGAAVKVAFVDGNGAEKSTASAKTGSDKRWMLRLPPLPGGLTGRITVSTDKNETVAIDDAIVGQVWLGGGQSNMAYKVASSNVAPKTLAEAKAQAASVRPAIRFFMTTSRGADEPQEDVQGHWVIAEPETISTCSAVAWYFGLALHEKLHTPVGLIVSSVGGTAVETWIPRKELDATSVASAIWKRHQDALAGYTKEKEEKYNREEAAWRTANPTPELKIKNAKARPKELYTPDNHHVPVRLYNGKIAGLEPYTIKGVIWFQADGNNSHPEEYSELIHTLIRTWRAHWNAELPFYYVEMNNMHPLQTKPDEDRPLAQIREAQNGALKLPRTGVVAAIDLGIAENAHFPIKKPVGDRLASLALTEVYGLSLGEVHSPEFSGCKLEGDKVRVHLKYAGGLRARDGAVRGFALQDESGHWTWAEGKVDGTDLLLWTAQAPRPQALRYAWAENPIISIENGAGLPLRPFRTVLKDQRAVPALAQGTSASLLPASWNPVEAANRVLSALVNTSAPQVKGAHDSEMTITNGRAFIVSESNEVKAGEAASWPFIYVTMSVVNLKTLAVGKIIPVAKSEQVFENETLPEGACFVPRILKKDAHTLRCFFASEAPSKRQSQIWYRDFDLKTDTFENKIHRAKIKTTAGTFDMQPQPFYDDAVAHGFQAPAKDFGLYIFDPIKIFDGKHYAAINNYAAGQEALAILNPAMDTFEVIGHFNDAQPGMKLTEPAVNRLPDGTWMAICRQEGGDHNYTFTTSRDGIHWSAHEHRPFVPNGAASRPTFDRFHGVYYLGWQENTRLNNVSRSVFNLDISRDGEHWERKYRFETEKSFQYPTFRESDGTIYLTVTQGDTDPSRKERIMFGKLE